MSKESKIITWSEREKLYDEINRKRWSKAKNLGKGEGIPEGWTLCDIGPKNAYIELSDEAIKKIDEDDIKGFWKDTCSLITPENLEYIFTNTKTYHDFLMRGVLLLYSRSKKHSLEYIKRNLKTIDKSLKKRLQKEKQKVTENIRVGYISLSEVVSILEKDFFRIKKSIDAYYKTSLQNALTKELGRIWAAKHRRDKVDFLEEKNIMLYSHGDIEADIEQNEIMNKIKYEIYPSLTQRQKLIYDKFKEGKTQIQIAEDLGISDKTVYRDKVKILNIIKKALKIST